MLLCDLPDDVLILVLRPLLQHTSDQRETFRRNLSLLAVCKRWRWLACPLVYNHVYAQYGTQRWSGQSTPGHGRVAEKSTKEPAVKTNVDLFAAAGCAGMAKSAAIDVYCAANPLPRLAAVVTRLRAATHEWGGVQRLELVLHTSTITGADEDNAAEHEHDMRMATNMLAEVMPRVQRLSLGGIAGNSVVRLLYGCVVAAYASQLQGIQCRCTINLPQGCWFAQLKDVDMNCSLASDYRLPQMSPGELTTLTLHYATSGRSWAPFSNEDGASEIEFPKLKVLNVACHSPQSGDGSPEACVEGGLQTLHFPRLEILRIRCSVNIQPLLNCAVLPAYLNEIHIDAIPTVLALLSRTTLPAARRVVVRVESGHGDRDEMFASVCGLLERTCSSSSTSSRAVELDIDVETIPVYARSITCTALTRLHVSGATRVDTMIALIRKLPNLNDLALFHVVADGLDSGPLLSGSGDKRAVPLSKTLRRCELMFAYEARLLDTAIPLVQYLLLRIPTLTHFISVQVPERPITEFVGAAAQRYPHLPAIKLSLGEDWDDYSSDYLNIVALVT